MNEEQLTGWEDPTARKQQESQTKFKESPKSVPDVGMGQKKVEKTEPQAY